MSLRHQTLALAAEPAALRHLAPTRLTTLSSTPSTDTLNHVMTIHIGTLTGTTFPLRVHANDTLDHLKHLIHLEVGVPPASQILIFRNQTLATNNNTISNNTTSNLNTLRDYAIHDGAKLNLVLHMVGGPGHPSPPPKPSAESNIVLFLCKQDTEIYILEVHLKPGASKRAKAQTLMELTANGFLNIDALSPDAILDEIAKLEDIGLDEIDRMAVDALSSSRVSTAKERPTSATSVASSFVSFVSDASTASMGSRPVSAFTGLSSRPTSTRQSSARFRNVHVWRPQSSVILTQRDVNVPKTRSQSASVRPMSASTKVSQESLEWLAREYECMIQRMEHALMSITNDPYDEPSSPILLPTSTPPLPQSPPPTVPTHSQSHSLPQPLPPPTLDHDTRPPKKQPLTYLRPTTTRIHIPPRPSSVSTRLSLKPPIHPSSTRSLAPPPPSSSLSSSGMKQVGTPPPPPHQTTQTTQQPPHTRTLVPRHHCFTCRKKLGLSSIKCRCGNVFCSVHRYSDRHACPFDYKEAGRVVLSKEYGIHNNNNNTNNGGEGKVERV